MELLLIFATFLIIGIAANFLLFYREVREKTSTRFITSERLIVFFIEILIAVIGFGVTLGVTNSNERQIEKEKAITMVEQTIEFTDNQLSREKSYLQMYNKEKISISQLKNSNVVSLDYYKNVLSNDEFIQNSDMKIYGEIMKYLVWVEKFDEKASAAESDKDIYKYLYHRYENLGKVQQY